MKVSVVINYCSIDRKFMPALLKQCLMFSDDIIIVSFDKLFSNVVEPSGDVDNFCSINPTVIKSRQLKFTNDNHPRHFHNLARWEAVHRAKNDYILFLDADEIPEGKILNHIFENNLVQDYDGVDFRCHWYFRSVNYQAEQKEICGLLINKKVITKDLMFTDSERWSFRQVLGTKYLSDTMYNGQILLHHFSWVRSHTEMLAKISSWGHKFDKDWEFLVNEEFSRPFNGTDFVHGYSYNIVDNVFNI